MNVRAEQSAVPAEPAAADFMRNMSWWFKGPLALLYRRIFRERVGIGMQIYLGLGSGIVMLILTSLLAYFYLGRVVGYQERLSVQTIPNLSAVTEVARRSTGLVSGAARLSIAENLSEHDLAQREIAREQAAIDALMETLSGDEILAEDLKLLIAHMDNYEALLAEIYDSSRTRLQIEGRLRERFSTLVEVSRQIELKVFAMIDDHGFYVVEGLRGINDQKSSLAQRASDKELARYRDLIEVNSQSNLAAVLLGQAVAMTEMGPLDELRERFEGAEANMRRAAGRLDGNLLAQIENLIDLGIAEDGIFGLASSSLRRRAQEARLLSQAREGAVAMLGDLEDLVEAANRQALTVNADSQSAAGTGSFLMAVLNTFGILGAVLIGWHFAHHLVTRLESLAVSMRDMAAGDLEATVNQVGNDEVTDMAEALEVFRRHALEVQRLNLVEQLATELEGKNHALEETLEELNKAQEQVAAEARLSSLGQLTAGVAHEIKNPLNFVNNFAEVSSELVDEIEEIIAEGASGELDTGEIQAILSDLRPNLGKIQEHSKRADSVVRNMLEHSRTGPGEWRETDLNGLLKQYMELTYHAMRAQSIAFNVTIEEELDADIGLMEVVPQDMGRAFLNIVTNACQAIDEKIQSDKAEADYRPTLRIASRRREDGFEFSVRDNGSGIPDEMREAIFEPFVTTKDAGKGTGLGLSLTADIIARHGGAIEVDSEFGKFTEMRFVLPLEPVGPHEEEEGAESVVSPA